MKGVLYSYAATATSYALSLAYVVVLTKCIPAEQYGQYNALQVLTGLIGMLFPTLGVDIAIAREGASPHGKGQDVSTHYSALFAISLAFSAAYASAIAAARPTRTNVLRALAYPLVKLIPLLRKLIVVVAEKVVEAEPGPLERWQCVRLLMVAPRYHPHIGGVRRQERRREAS